MNYSKEELTRMFGVDQKQIDRLEKMYNNIQTETNYQLLKRLGRVDAAWNRIDCLDTKTERDEYKQRRYHAASQILITEIYCRMYNRGLIEDWTLDYLGFSLKEYQDQLQEFLNFFGRKTEEEISDYIWLLGDGDWC